MNSPGFHASPVGGGGASCAHRAIVIAVLALSGAARLGAQDTTITLAGRRVAVWHPRESSARQPVLLFSHGFGGCGAQSTFLMKALAEHGYWVFAPDHEDARCRRSGSARSQPEEPFRDPANWSDRTYADRRDDLMAIRAALTRSPAYATHLDFDRLGLIGHSLGGYTVVGLAGGWASWKMPGVKAVLALSPYVQPYIEHHTLGGLTAPIMYQGGTLDIGITPWVRRAGGAYDASPAPKYFVDFTGAGHLAWTDLQPRYQAEITDYAIAFLDHYLRGTPAPGLLTTAQPGVRELRYRSEPGNGGRR
jgi:predicted dienelactone hydrolase